jgi:pimeloyl-ACP methyl ester carboxylesterase
MTEEEKALHGIDNPDGFVLEWMQTVRGIIDSGGDLSVSLAASIRTPLLMMLGTEDTLNPPDYAQRVIDQVNAANPSRTDLARLEMFDCGHAVHELQPEAFRAALGAHLRRR